jgi:hypothetical protein
MPDALEATAAREAEAMFHAEGDVPVWGAGLADLVAVLEERHVDHLFIGGIASRVHGRPRVTRDLDVMVRPTDARPVLEGLAARGYETDERAPHWLFKAHGNGAEIDVIFQAVGEMYLDDAMLARGVWTDAQGTRIRVAGPEDTFVMKALAHRELSPRHWFDGLAIIANGSLDWDVVVELASTRPRRVLSLLLYAQSEDLFVPSWVIDRLYHASRGDDDRA